MLEDETSRAAFQSYTGTIPGQPCEVLGYVYPLVNYPAANPPGTYLDADQDGLPDAVETFHDLFADAMDTDCDGASDLAEFPLQTVQGSQDPKQGAAGCADLKLEGVDEHVGAANRYQARFTVTNVRGPQVAGASTLRVLVSGTDAALTIVPPNCTFQDVGEQQRRFDCPLPPLGLVSATEVIVLPLQGHSAQATLVRTEPDPFSSNNAAITVVR